MKSSQPIRFWAFMLLATGLVGPPPIAVAQHELSKKASWQVVEPERIRVWAADLAQEAHVDLERLPALAAQLQNEDQVMDFPLMTIGQVIATLIPKTQELISVAQRSTGSLETASRILESDAFDDETIPKTARDHLRLIAGRWLAQHDFYDESLTLMKPIETDEVLEPATLLFYRGLCYHRLLDKESCVDSLNRLLENQEKIPKRFSIVANLMLSDIEPLKEDSLDEIARLMDDIRRRQTLYRSGTQVLGLEQKVIDKLDKMIEKIEQQLQNAQQTGANQVKSADPMKDSQSAGGLGPGNVTDRRLGEGGSWGDLPPKQRAAALAEMAKDLPPHYREVIEEYFRQLAKEPNK